MTEYRAPREWHIEERFGRFYVVNQHGGFSGWSKTRGDANWQLADYLFRNPGDTRSHR